ncbi:UDP-N-acetylglucosamine 2-epimerase [Candidatus Saccharibacteria bacterium]|nr:UDP-N-acetylglucosamine 2-epimerase [Candidatus Saccharibacteria bacterium]
MLIFIYGTTGELIKIAPILKAVPREQYLLINTVQQAKQLPKLQAQLLIKDDFLLANGYKGRDLENYFQALRWLPAVFKNFFNNRKKIKRAIKENSSTQNLVLVHGDTNTTVLGAVFGRLLGMPVAHVEAGLRSFDIMHPFPEELNRRIVSRIARLHFAPGDQPVKNLNKNKGVVINTAYNTVKDSIDLVRHIDTIELPKNLPEHYGIVSIHRNELLSDKNGLRDFLKVLSEGELTSSNLIFLEHPVTAEKIRVLGYGKYLESPNIIRLPKLDYPTFMKLLGGANFVLTDSGGLQEECTYLNIPCVVHRKVTERMEGLGANVELTGMKAELVAEILAKLLKRTSSASASENQTSPTQIITNYLGRGGYITLAR